MAGTSFGMTAGFARGSHAAPEGAGREFRRLGAKPYLCTREMKTDVMLDTEALLEKYYADIERGYCGMSLDTMVDIARCLGITLDYIIFGKEDKRKLSKESAGILLYLEKCTESKRKKAMELLKVYLEE